MTVTMMSERSLDNKKEATCEFEKFGSFKAYVYEYYGGDWHTTHESQPTSDPTKAIAAYKRFVRKYIK